MEKIILRAEELPRHTHGVEIYGGRFPDGTPVERPCIKCEKFNGFWQCSDCYNMYHNKCFVPKKI